MSFTSHGECSLCSHCTLIRDADKPCYRFSPALFSSFVYLAMHTCEASPAGQQSSPYQEQHEQHDMLLDLCTVC